jgi:hypothetical protein
MSWRGRARKAGLAGGAAAMLCFVCGRAFALDPGPGDPWSLIDYYPGVAGPVRGHGAI